MCILTNAGMYSRSVRRVRNWHKLPAKKNPGKGRDINMRLSNQGETVPPLPEELELEEELLDESLEVESDEVSVEELLFALPGNLASALPS